MEEPEVTLAFSQACENNKIPILKVLQKHLHGNEKLLEVGSGTGQHAEFFARQFPNLIWQCSDLVDNYETINTRLTLANLSNTPAVMTCDVSQIQQVNIEHEPQYDMVFSANTLHIMAWSSVLLFFPFVTKHLKPSAKLIVYGPFNNHDGYSSESNARFDDWLKSQNNYSGIRGFDAVNEQAKKQGLALIDDIGMPANNRCLVWQKIQ